MDVALIPFPSVRSRGMSSAETLASRRLNKAALCSVVGVAVHSLEKLTGWVLTATPIKFKVGTLPASRTAKSIQTLAMADDQSAQYEQFMRPARRDAFLATMERIVLWATLCGVLKSHYPKPGNGCPPVGLERMPRIYFVQQWFNLADTACEDALLDSTALRRFVGINLRREPVPDATTLLKFRRLLEKHGLGAALFAKVGEVLQANGLKVGTDTIVDATTVGSPNSTKSAQGELDPRSAFEQHEQAMVLRHEVAYRRAQQDGSGAQRGGDIAKRA